MPAPGEGAHHIYSYNHFARRDKGALQIPI
jgi:hypothetical protein